MADAPGGAADSRSLERTLWLAAYVLAVLAPLALVYVADKPGADSFGVRLAAGLGFAGMTILALQFVMPSRARSFTSPFGVDVLLRFHREIGLVGLVLVVAHVAVLVVDDPGRLSLLDPADAPWRARAGLAATIALLALVGTSLWRRRVGLRYERWRALHLVLGAAIVAFAFAHVVLVAEYLAAGTIRWATLLFVVAAAGGLFYLRVGRPFSAAGRAYRVRAVRAERGGATTLELEAGDGRGEPFQPGQFAWLKLAEAPYSLTEHPFSFSSSALRPGRPAFTIKAAGDFTERVADLEPGTPILLDGPHGSFRPDPAAPGFVFVAGGIGITPVISVLRTFADAGDRRPLTLVYASRTWDDATFREELDELSCALDLQVVHVLSRAHDGWAGERGRVDAELLARVLPAGSRERTFLVCGPPAMTDAAVEAIERLGVPPARVHAERFASV